jgi:hypothetical protein
LRSPGLVGANPRDGRAVGTPGADPGKRRGFVRANPMGPPRPPSGEGSPGKTWRGPGEIPRESPGRRGGRPRGKAPGAQRETPRESPRESTWGDGGSGGAGGRLTLRAGAFRRRNPVPSPKDPGVPYMKHLPSPRGLGCSVYETPPSPKGPGVPYMKHPPSPKGPGCSVCETPPSARILWRQKNVTYFMAPQNSGLPFPG